MFLTHLFRLLFMAQSQITGLPPQLSVARHRSKLTPILRPYNKKAGLAIEAGTCVAQWLAARDLDRLVERSLAQHDFGPRAPNLDFADVRNVRGHRDGPVKLVAFDAEFFQQVAVAL